MTDASTQSVLVVLNVPPSLEETVVDWLLAREDSTGFTSFPVFGHSTSHDGLSLAEQVTGRQRRQQFQVLLAEHTVDAFLEDARRSLGAAGIRYWAIPLMATGRFGSPT